MPMPIYVLFRCTFFPSYGWSSLAFCAFYFISFVDVVVLSIACYFLHPAYLLESVGF